MAGVLEQSLEFTAMSGGAWSSQQPLLQPCQSTTYCHSLWCLVVPDVKAKCTVIIFREDSESKKRWITY